MRALLASAALAMVLAAGCTQSDETADSAVPPRALPELSVETTFHGLWWSEAQMEGLDPDAPPPKATSVRLTTWESSDPVGSPHPDTVDAVVVLRNTGRVEATGLVVTVDGEWLEGRLDDSASAVWSQPVELRQRGGIRLAPGAVDTVRVAIPVSERTTRLFASERWPHALRVTVVVGSAGGTPPFARERAVLPIRPGD